MSHEMTIPPTFELYRKLLFYYKLTISDSGVILSDVNPQLAKGLLIYRKGAALSRSDS